MCHGKGDIIRILSVWWHLGYRISILYEKEMSKYKGYDKCGCKNADMEQLFVQFKKT